MLLEITPKVKKYSLSLSLYVCFMLLMYTLSIAWQSHRAVQESTVEIATVEGTSNEGMSEDTKRKFEILKQMATTGQNLPVEKKEEILSSMKEQSSVSSSGMMYHLQEIE